MYEYDPGIGGFVASGSSRSTQQYNTIFFFCSGSPSSLRSFCGWISGAAASPKVCELPLIIGAEPGWEHMNNLWIKRVVVIATFKNED